LKAFIFIFYTFLISCTVLGQSKIPAETKKYLKLCADSINTLNENDKLPSFLYNACLDYQKEYWIDMHHPLPLRKLIIDKIINEKAIEFILSHYEDTLDKPCKPCIETKKKPNGLTYYTVPLLKESFIDLLRSRLYKLKYH